MLSLYRPFFALCLCLSVSASAVEIELPKLGDTSSALISLRQEKQLGDVWLRQFRARVPTVSDPILQSYLEGLVGRLAVHSELVDKEIKLVVVDNEALNAFAVPGGIMGINNGLFLHAQTEEQMASVVAHELAHISQRHFARSLQEAQGRSVASLAGLLAGIVLMATAGGDAGMAALTATQAASMQSQLRFSRSHEKEADRVGIRTLAAAGMNPMATAHMFERMLYTRRYTGSKIPEFLLTHPITENRIADARARASRYPVTINTGSLDYQRMRARVQLEFAETPAQAVKFFQAELEDDHRNAEAHRYGLSLALTKANRLQEAAETIAPLLEHSPNDIIYQLAAADIDRAAGLFDRAIERVEAALKVSPRNHPLTMHLADTLMSKGDVKRAERILEAHSRRRPRDPDVWYLLAEIHGLAGNIQGVHNARAEFFMLIGVFDEARRQINYALNLSQGDFVTSARLEQRLKDLEKMMETKL